MTSRKTTGAKDSAQKDRPEKGPPQTRNSATRPGRQIAQGRQQSSGQGTGQS